LRSNVKKETFALLERYIDYIRRGTFIHALPANGEHYKRSLVAQVEKIDRKPKHFRRADPETRQPHYESTLSKQIERVENY